MLNGAPITGAGEGWMISTKAMQENGLKTLDDVLARPDLFPHPKILQRRNCNLSFRLGMPDCN